MESYLWIITILQFLCYNCNYLLFCLVAWSSIGDSGITPGFAVDKMNFSIWDSIVSSGNQGATPDLHLTEYGQLEKQIKTSNLIGFINLKHIKLILQEVTKICKQGGVGCCWQHCWVKIQLVSAKILKVHLITVVYRLEWVEYTESSMNDFK